MPDDYTQANRPIGGVSTELARMAGKAPPEMRSYILAHPGEYSDTEFRSAQRAENAIRKHKRRNRGQTQDGLADIVRTQERGRI